MIVFLINESFSHETNINRGYWAIGLVGSVHQWSGKPGFNSRSSHTKDSKMVLDAALLNTQHYKVWIKSKWNNLGKGVAPPLHLSVVAIEKGAFRSPNLLTYNMF